MLTSAVLHRWEEIPSDAIGDRIVRKYITGSRMTVARFDLKRGAAARRHAHDAEEMLCVVRGAVKLAVEDQELVVHQGEVVEIPSDVPHELEALEDSEVLDVFSPIRQDWIDGTDSYYAR